MATIIRTVHNSSLVNLTLFVPGYDTIKPPIVIAPSATLDLFTVLATEELETIQNQLAAFVAAGDMTVIATTDTTTFSPTSMTIHADANPNLTGNVQLVSGTNITLSQAGQAITVNATGGGATPGGNNNDIQINISGAFSGTDDLTWQPFIPITAQLPYTLTLSESTLLHLTGPSDGGVWGSAVTLTTADSSSVVGSSFLRGGSLTLTTGIQSNSSQSASGGNIVLTSGDAVVSGASCRGGSITLTSGNDNGNGGNIGGSITLTAFNPLNGGGLYLTGRAAGEGGGSQCGQLGIGVAGVGNVVSLQVDSTTRGVLFPRMTSTQKNNIDAGSYPGGLVVFDTTLMKLCVTTNNGSWETITSA